LIGLTLSRSPRLRFGMENYGFTSPQFLLCCCQLLRLKTKLERGLFMKNLAVGVMTLGVFLSSGSGLPAAPSQELLADFPLFNILSGSHSVWTSAALGLYYPNPTPVLIAYDVTPSQVSRTFSWTADNTPGFSTISALMTDGLDENINIYESGNWGGNSESAWLTGIFGSSLSMNGIDLQGFDISRIDMRVDSLTLTTPGRDLYGDGNWTDIDVSGQILIYGSPVPEPATFTLLGLGSLAWLRVRRGREALPL
jgi:hypothetical protein